MDEALAAAQAAAKNAKRAATLTMFAVIVAIAVLVIDNSIKRAVLEKADEARRTLDEFKHVVVEASHGTETAGEAGSAGSADLNGGGGVVHDAAAGAVLAEAPRPKRAAPARKPARAARGPRGNA